MELCGVNVALARKTTYKKQGDRAEQRRQTNKTLVEDLYNSERVPAQIAILVDLFY